MACVGLLLSSAQRENEWSSTFASPYAIRCAQGQLYLYGSLLCSCCLPSSVVPKIWLAMPRGNSENSLQCFLPSPWGKVLVLKISTSYEMICIFFLNAKGNYHVHKRTPPAPVLSQMTPFHPLPCVYLLRPILLLTVYQRLGFPSNVFSVRVFQPKLCVLSVLCHACYMPCPAHRYRYGHANICREVQTVKFQ